MTKRFTVILFSLTIFVICGLVAMFFLVRTLRQEARNRYYQQLAANHVGEISITVPEGYRREQIAALLEDKGVTSADDFMTATDGDEGKLFPDTYLFYPGATANSVRQKFIDNYNTKLASLGTVTKNQLIIASIVEREAKQDSDRPGIAGVYYNRLSAGFNLGADPTVQYAKETLALTAALKEVKTVAERSAVIKDFKFWQPITRADYSAVESEYNTYKVVGLPPTPICNPGLASINAAVKPATSEYYYFLTGSDGQTYYAKTLEEHNRNKAAHL